MLYAAAFEASRSGTPLMRRCDLEWPEMPEASDSTQYLLGDDLLVAPILEPARPGDQSERTVWIPPGEWQDMWTGRTYRGPTTMGVACGLGEVPVFVRCGGLVLSTAQRQTTGNARWPELVVDAFVPKQDQDQTRWLYEDDGCSTEYKRGAFALTKFQLRQRGQNTEITLEPTTSKVDVYPERRTVTMRVHLPEGARVRSVQRDGRALDYSIVQPSAGRAAQLFGGPGASPPFKAGPVVEWRGEVRGAEAVTIHLIGGDT